MKSIFKFRNSNLLSKNGKVILKNEEEEADKENKKNNENIKNKNNKQERYSSYQNMTIKNTKNVDSKLIIESKKLSLLKKLDGNETNNNDNIKGSKVFISKRK